MEIFLTLPFVALVINIAIYFIINSYTTKTIQKQLIAFFLGFIVVISCTATRIGQLEFDLLIAIILTYIFLSFIFFNLISGLNSSIRIKIVLLIGNENSVSLKDLRRIFSTQNIIDFRLRRMVSTKVIIYRNNKYVVNSNLIILIMNLFIFLKFLFDAKQYRAK